MAGRGAAGAPSQWGGHERPYGGRGSGMTRPEAPRSGPAWGPPATLQHTRTWAFS